MGKRILIIQGHPDATHLHLCHALAEAYAEGARAAGHLVETLEPAQLAFPLLSDPADWQDGAVPAVLLPAQEAIARAQHLLLIYPLWLGDMPARLKGFLEQVLRPGFAIAREAGNPLRSGLLAGCSARIVVTMGMPAPLYRWFYRAHGLQLLRRNILQFAGIRPVATTVVGTAGAMPPRRVAAWRARLYQLGTRAA